MKLGLNSLLWVVAFLLLGVSVVYFFSIVVNLGSAYPINKSAANLPAGTTPTVTSFSGTVVKVDPLSAGFGTHRLTDKSGNVSAYLESRSIDLRILEGSKITVEGKRERMVAAGIPLIAVEKVNFD